MTTSAGPDRTTRFLATGYPFLRAVRAGAPAATVRLMGRPALVIGGPDAVRLFYDRERMTRIGAIPALVRRELFGDGAVQTLEGPEHLQRKRVLMAALGPDRVADLAARADRLWEAALDRWAGAPRVVLFDEAVRVLGVAALGSAGVPLTPSTAPRLVTDLYEIVDGFGTDPVAHLRGTVAHARALRWARRLVERTRTGELSPDPASSLAVLAAATDHEGRAIDARSAALDLLNSIRPTVAVAWHVTYAAMALQEHPQWRARLADGAGPGRGAELEAFAHEVRRFYPFTPALAARARAAFTWQGHEVAAGQLVVLDVHGTNHDPRSWQHHDHFYPHRFHGTTAAGLPAGDHDPDAFVPNGGGDVWTGHRCAGEAAMTAVLTGAISVLVGLSYHLPPQDLGVSTRRIPPRPGDGFVMTGVRRVGTEGPADRAGDRGVPARHLLDAPERT